MLNQLHLFHKWKWWMLLGVSRRWKLITCFIKEINTEYKKPEVLKKTTWAQRHEWTCPEAQREQHLWSLGASIGAAPCPRMGWLHRAGEGVGRGPVEVACSIVAQRTLQKTEWLLAVRGLQAEAPAALRVEELLVAVGETALRTFKSGS